MVSMAAVGSIYPGLYSLLLVTPPTIIQHEFWVDWNNDGVFAGGYEDITEDVMAYEWERGRDFISQIAGRSSAGNLRLILRNDTGKYNRFNGSSVLSGSLEVKRRVQHNMLIDGVVFARFGGWIRRLPTADFFTLTAELEAAGTLYLLTQSRVSPAASAGAATGTLIGSVLTEANIAAADQSLDTGTVVTSRWGIDNERAYDAIRDLELTELGFIFEGGRGQIVFQDKDSRLSGSGLVSQDTYSDAPGHAKSYLKDSREIDPIDDVWNEVIAHVHYYTVQALAVLWTFGGANPVLTAGESVTVTARYDGGDHEHVSAWTTPVVGTDVTQTGVANGDIEIAVTKRAKSMTITITNNHATTSATITLIRARGTAATVTTTEVRDVNTDSEPRYGLRTLPLEGHYLPDLASAVSYVAALLSRYGEPQPILELEFELYSTALADAICRREISDRVTVVATGILTNLGIEADFFIERISERCDFSDGRHFVRFALSSAVADDYWILNTSELGINTKVGY